MSDKALKWKLKLDELHLVHGDRHYATVFNNGVWHTWDANGTGLENSSAATVQRAMEEAAQSVITQGLIVF